MSAITATSPDFRHRFCAHFHCPDQDFEKKVLMRAIPFPLIPLARIVHSWKPGYFEQDRKTIRRLGAVRDSKIFRDELDDLQYIRQRDNRYWRRRLGIKASLARLDRLRQIVFAVQ